MKRFDYSKLQVRHKRKSRWAIVKKRMSIVKLLQNRGEKRESRSKFDATIWRKSIDAQNANVNLFRKSRQWNQFWHADLCNAWLSDKLFNRIINSSTESVRLSRFVPRSAFSFRPRFAKVSRTIVYFEFRLCQKVTYMTAMCSK